jgi:hypothetical protein
MASATTRTSSLATAQVRILASSIEDIQEDESMRITLSVLPLILAVHAAIHSAMQVPVQGDRKACWIVEVTTTNAGEVDYVDGVRVPEDVGTVNFLRLRERETSPRSCMLAFVSSSARIENVDNMRAIAGKIGFQESHVYLYEEQDRAFAREILWSPQVSAEPVGKWARTIDVATTKTGETDYVDGKTVPSDMTTIEYLRQEEKRGPRTSLVVFVTAFARLADVEKLRRIAEKMQYKDFHAYVRDGRDRERAVEILYGPRMTLDELRSGPNGPLPLPDSRPAEK